jgi:hypothetical protein
VHPLMVSIAAEPRRCEERGKSRPTVALLRPDSVVAMDRRVRHGGMRDTPEGTLMSAFAQTLCQRCGAWAEQPIVPGRSAVEPCSCGGVRQVIRITKHRRGEPPNGPTGSNGACAIAPSRRRRRGVVAASPRGASRRPSRDFRVDGDEFIPGPLRREAGLSARRPGGYGVPPPHPCLGVRVGGAFEAPFGSSVRARLGWVRCGYHA